MPKTTLPIEIKISTVVAISTILHSADLEAIDSALASMTGGVSDFFEDEFAVIDVSAFTSSAWTIDWAAIVALLKKYRLNAVAVRGASPLMIDAIRAQGLALDDGSGGVHAGGHATPPPLVVHAAAAPAPEPVPAPVAPAPEPAPAASQPGAPALAPLVIDTPVRAGQRIYARGTDLIVTAVVN
ncbi:MAG: septum site-determining protein MinC, partial [Oxalobacteraceae bacterium]